VRTSVAVNMCINCSFFYIKLMVIVTHETRDSVLVGTGKQKGIECSVNRE